MTAWQTDLMVERQSEALWARMNRPDPEEDLLKGASERIKCGLDSIDNGLDWLADAVSVLNGTPMADRVQSILNDLENMANGLEEINRHYERGERV